MRMLFTIGLARRASFNVTAAPRGGKAWCAIGGERVRGEATGSEHGKAAGAPSPNFVLSANIRPKSAHRGGLGPIVNLPRPGRAILFPRLKLSIATSMRSE